MQGTLSWASLLMHSGTLHGRSCAATAVCLTPNASLSPGYRPHEHINALRPTQVSVLLGCQSGSLMRSETPPTVLSSVCVFGVEGVELYTSESMCLSKVEGVELFTPDAIYSVHMTIQLMTSGQVYLVPEPEPKYQLLQNLRGLLYNSPNDITHDSNS